MPTFSDALRALQPTPDADHDAYLPAFRAAADLILNRSDWMIAGRPHQILEIEFYWQGGAHPDPFTHADPHQRELGRWYFHRQGGQWRGGTYKGIDIAFGREDTCAGILIRAARAPDGAVIEGPSLCVDHLLRETGHAAIRDLVAAEGRDLDPAPGGSPLHLVLTGAPRDAALCEGPRVGLTLKREPFAARVAYLARPYRFISEPAAIKKGRPNLAVGLHRQGLDVPEIAARTGWSAAQVARAVEHYEAGVRRDPADFSGDLGPDDTCALFGACDAAARA